MHSRIKALALAGVVIIYTSTNAFSQSGPEWEFYDGTFMRKDLAESMTTSALVTAISPATSGKVSVTFKGEEGKHPGGQSKWIWEWKELGRPVPLCVGQNVTITVSSRGQVRRMSWFGYVVLARKRPTDTQIEYLIATNDELIRNPDGSERTKPLPPYVRVWPHFASIVTSTYSADVVWNATWGLSVALWEAGSGVDEKELERTRRKGVAVANDENVRVFAGRDGWRKLEMRDLDNPKLVPPEQHYKKTR